MMDRMFADMDTLMATAMPDPEQMIRSVMQGDAAGGARIGRCRDVDLDRQRRHVQPDDHLRLPGQWRPAAGQG